MDADLRCSCKSVHYCGKACQKSHWKEHKPHCTSKKCNAKSAKETSTEETTTGSFVITVVVCASSICLLSLLGAAVSDFEVVQSRMRQELQEALIRGDKSEADNVEGGLILFMMVAKLGWFRVLPLIVLAKKISFPRRSCEASAFRTRSRAARDCAACTSNLRSPRWWRS